MKGPEAVAMSVILLALTIQSPIISITIPSNSVIVSVTPSPVKVGYNFTIAGKATTALGCVTGTTVSIRVVATNGTTVSSTSIPVIGRGSSGTYSHIMKTASTWQLGEYSINATYHTPSGASVSNATSFSLVE